MLALLLTMQAAAVAPCYNPAVCSQASARYQEAVIELDECRMEIGRKYDLSHGQRPAEFIDEVRARCDHVKCWAAYMGLQLAKRNGEFKPMPPMTLKSYDDAARFECLTGEILNAKN